MLAPGWGVRAPHWSESASRSYHLSEAQVAAATRGRRPVAGVGRKAPASTERGKTASARPVSVLAYALESRCARENQPGSGQALRDDTVSLFS